MGLYDKYARLAGERLQFSDNGLTPFGTCIDEVYSATEGRIGNKKVILAGTNNYLGLTFNHDAIAEGQTALAAQGTGRVLILHFTLCPFYILYNGLLIGKLSFY